MYANRDRRVNLADFNILAGNFGQPNRIFSQGDFNYDINRNLARNLDGDPSNDDYWSPVSVFSRLGFVCANLSITAPEDGTHEKSGDRVIDQFWIGGPLLAEMHIEDLFYHESSGKHGGSYGSDHKAAQLKLTIG